MSDEERDARIETLLDAIADTNRNLGGAIAALTADVASLTRVVRLHLIHDHGYEDPEL